MSLAVASGVLPEIPSMTDASITAADITISSSAEVTNWSALSSKPAAPCASSGPSAILITRAPHANKARLALMRNKPLFRDILYAVIDNATPPMTIIGSGEYPRLPVTKAAKIIKIAKVAV